MKPIFFAWMQAVLFVICLEAGSAQADMTQAPILDIPGFNFEALCFSSSVPGTGRLDVYVEIPFEALHFLKVNDVFRATYDVTVSIYDNTERLADEKLWTETIETKKYEESISPKAGNLTQKSFPLSPGDYVVSVQVQDNDTRKISRLKREVKVKDFSLEPFSLSNIMLVSRVGNEDQKKVVYPNISGNVGELKEKFYILFEIYNHVNADSAIILSTVKNFKGDALQHDSIVQPLESEKKTCILEVNSTKLLTGDYTLEVQALPLGARLKSEASVGPVVSSRPFTLRWRGLPVSLGELDQAIDELQYLTDKDKIDEMKNSAPEIKRKKFFEFWKKRDPSPNTERNELMEEYYARVAYANKNFSHYLDGWKTDMGMVYIIFGPPNNIDRHPFDIDSKPYEVWTYYELNREFVFIDATGFGDYRLQNPIWDVWRTRPR